MSNELVSIEQPKPSFLQSVKAFFYKIGNGDKKFRNGPIADLNRITERMQSDALALKERNTEGQVNLAEEMNEVYKQVVPGITSKANPEMVKAVIESKKRGEQTASLSVIANLSKNQKKAVVNKAEKALTDKTVEKQVEAQVEKDIEERE